MIRRRGGLAALSALALVTVLLASCAPAPVPFEAGDHVVLIGNALADRMQHDGWLETYLQTELPGARAGLPQSGFRRRPDRSPAAREGVPGRRRVPGDVGRRRHLRHVRLQRVVRRRRRDGRRRAPMDRAAPEGSTTPAAVRPRIVLFSPIAHENLGDPNLPDGSANNARSGPVHRGIELRPKPRATGS